MDSEQTSFIKQYVAKQFELESINNFIFGYHMILHEYRHSQQSYDLLISSRRYWGDNYGYRQLPAEKDADEFAFNFIKEHWDFLMS
jgi:hypothetical protein